MEKIQELENRIHQIELRNKSVETDKKWESSATRKIILMIFTYLAILSYFAAIGIERPFLNAVVPTLGFLLSTLTLPFFKKMWISFQKK